MRIGGERNKAVRAAIGRRSLSRIFSGSSVLVGLRGPSKTRGVLNTVVNFVCLVGLSA